MTPREGTRPTGRSQGRGLQAGCPQPASIHGVRWHPKNAKDFPFVTSFARRSQCPFDTGAHGSRHGRVSLFRCSCRCVVSRPFLSTFVRDLPWAAAGILLAMAFTASAQTLTNTLPGRTVVRMVADPYRDVVYALNSGTATVPGSIVTLDPATGGVLGEVATGRLATDLALAPEGNALYVINAGNRTVARYSTQPVALGETRTVTTPGTYDPSLIFESVKKFAIYCQILSCIFVVTEEFRPAFSKYLNNYNNIRNI